MKRLSRIFVALIGLGAAACAGGGDMAENMLSPYGGFSSLSLQEYSQRDITVRYLTSEGFPIQSQPVRFNVEGATNGAAVTDVVARTDAQGLATTRLQTAQQANFRLTVSAVGASPLSIPVMVAQSNGGALQVQVYMRSIVSGAQAELTIVEQLPCSVFDPNKPPAGSPSVMPNRQNVAASTSGTSASFSGLLAGRSYTVVAIARQNNATVAKGCVDNLSITQQDIDRKLPLSTTLYLDDYTPGVNVDGLLIETRLQQPLQLQRVANLLNEIAYNPLDYIILHSLQTDDKYIALLGLAAKDTLVSYVTQHSNVSSMFQKATKLQNVAQALSNINDLKVVTALKVDAQSQGSQTMSATHSFKYVNAVVGGQRRDFFVQNGTSVVDGSAYTLDAQTTLTVSNASRVEFAPHTMSLPVADAILGTLLRDNALGSNIESIFSAFVDCSSIGQLAADYYKSYIDPTSYVMASLIKNSMHLACQDVIGDITQTLFGDMISDIKDVGLAEQVTLEGSANMTMLSDGSTIGQLQNGQWLGIGTFTGTRH